VKLDLKVLRERLRALLGDVVPGNEDQIELEILREISPPGIDIVNDVIPALGDEIAVLVYPAGANEMLPNFVIGADARDEAALAKLVEAIRAMVPEAVARFSSSELPGGIRATRVAAATPYDLHYAIHKRHFLFASSGKLLAAAASKWGAEEAPRLIRDDPVLPLVLKALNGGDTGSLAALGYVNLRGCGAEAVRAQMMWGQFLPQDWLDPKGAGEIRRIPNHLTGAAVALRHDKDGVTLDCFSPTGLLAPAVIAGIALERQRVMVRQVAVQQRAGSGKASLGITTRSLDAGVKILALAADGAAAAAGLLQGDRVIGIDGVEIATIEALDDELAKRKPGQRVQVRIRRGDQELTLPVELGEEEETGW
jgi:hypothetical protein